MITCNIPSEILGHLKEHLGEAERQLNESDKVSLLIIETKLGQSVLSQTTDRYLDEAVIEEEEGHKCMNLKMLGRARMLFQAAEFRERLENIAAARCLDRLGKNYVSELRKLTLFKVTIPIPVTTIRWANVVGGSCNA